MKWRFLKRINPNDAVTTTLSKLSRTTIDPQVLQLVIGRGGVVHIPMSEMFAELKKMNCEINKTILSARTREKFVWVYGPVTTTP